MIVDEAFVDCDERPKHLWHRSLHDLLQEFTPETRPGIGEYVWFEVEGFDRTDLLLWIYVRPSPTRFDSRNFPLVRLTLEGPALDTTAKERPGRSGKAPTDGLMHGVGAFRSLIAYLDNKLPQRGFTGILLEHVINEQLQTVAERYGFRPIGRPELQDFMKPLGDELSCSVSAAAKAESSRQHSPPLGDRTRISDLTSQQGLKACPQTFPVYASYIPELILTKVSDKPTLQKLKAAGLLLMIANEQRKGRATTNRQLSLLLGPDDASVLRLVNEFVYRGVLTKRKILNKQGRGYALELLFSETEELRQAFGFTMKTTADLPRSTSGS